MVVSGIKNGFPCILYKKKAFGLQTTDWGGFLTKGTCGHLNARKQREKNMIGSHCFLGNPSQFGASNVKTRHPTASRHISFLAPVFAARRLMEFSSGMQRLWRLLPTAS